MPRLRPANEFAGYDRQVALRRLPANAPQVRCPDSWAGEPAQAGLVPFVARGFNRCDRRHAIRCHRCHGPFTTASRAATPRERVTGFAFVTPALPLNIIVNPPTSDSSPHVTYVGIARSDHVPIEARAGGMGGPIGTEVFDMAGGLPDLQVIVSQPLGNGSTAVCDRLPPNAGGVPATTPLEFSDLPTVVNAINDLSCRAESVALTSAGACTTPDAQTGEFAFIDPSSTIQYCVPIDRPWAFNAGDTVVAARVRDIVGQLSEVEEIVVRITSGPGTLR